MLELDGPNPWTTRSTRVVYASSRLLLREDSVTQPNGQPGSYVYLEVDAPVVSVVPITDANNVYLVRQWRYPWASNSWEIPSGGAEGDESPRQAAERELAEEVGLYASSWEDLGTGYSSAAIRGRWYLYLARDLRQVPIGAHRRDGSEQDLIARSVPLTDAVVAAVDGRIEHGMSALGLLRAARRLGV